MGKMSMEVIKAQVGYIDRIGDLVKKEGLTMDDFQYMLQKSVNTLTAEEKAHLANIRNALPRPDANTIMQKVISEADLERYLNGQYDGVQGFVTIAADTKQLDTFDRLYYGLRLDYKDSPFTKTFIGTTDRNCAVLRFKSDQAGTAVIPTLNEVDVNSYPFTGTGFTSGKMNNLGVPEWQLKGAKDHSIPIKDESEIWRISEDGHETLVARYINNKFVKVN
jgi:hypothetical protein